MSRTVCVTVDVDVDLEDFDTDDLLEELEARNVGVSNVEDVTEMFYAFKLSRLERAIELAKKIAQDHTGGIL